MSSQNFLHIHKRPKREDWTLLFLVIPSLIFAILLSLLATSTSTRQKISSTTTEASPEVLGTDISLPKP